MSNAWSIFVIAATLVTLVGTVWFLLANRRITTGQARGHDYDGIDELDNPLPFWWVWMFIGSLVFAAAYVAYYPGLGNWGGAGNWTSRGQHDADAAAHAARFAPLYAGLAALDTDALVDSRTGMQVGRRLYVNYCSTCHGVAATGGAGYPNLTDGEWIWGGEIDAIVTTIRGGRVGAMPPWGPVLGESGVADVTQHVLRLAGLEHDAQAADRGAAQYAAFCVACHGVEGMGNSALGAANLTNDIWLYGGTPEAIAATIREGRMGRMPAHDSILDSDKTRILAAYVKSLSR